MTDTQTLAPWEGDTAPVLFGVEHEYNTGGGDFDRCYCDECVDDYDGCDDGYEPPGPASIPPLWEQHEEHCGWEIKTNPTRDIAAVVRGFQQIEQELESGHDDCGYHIHLNADPDNGPAVNVHKFAANWLAHRAELWANCPSDDGRIGLNGDRSEFSRAIPDTVEEWAGLRERFQELNWLSLPAHCTLEVRAASATSNKAHFEQWLRLVLAVADQSLLSDDWEAEYIDKVSKATAPYWATRHYNAVGEHLLALGTDPVAVEAWAVRKVS